MKLKEMVLQARERLKDSVLRAELNPRTRRWGTERKAWSLSHTYGGGFHTTTLLTPFGWIELLIPED